MEKETVAAKALRLLSPIPASDFITGKFSDEKSKCCAIGHYTRLTSENPNDFTLSIVWIMVKPMNYVTNQIFF